MVPISFYVIAHQDDWQLFRSEQVWADIQLGARVVFVYLTAGDAGRTDGWWQAREQAAMASCRLASPGQIEYAVQPFNGHAITVAACGATASYFFHLPDGYLDNGGLGTDAYGHQSLLQLRLNSKSVTAVDGSTKYTTCADLCATVAEIIRSETANSGNLNPWLNCHDYDATFNPGDHPDHYETGTLVQTLAAEYSVAWWVGYDLKYRDPNLQPDQIATKTRLSLCYHDTLHTLTGFDEQGYEPYWSRSYFRSQPPRWPFLLSSGSRVIDRIP